MQKPSDRIEDAKQAIADTFKETDFISLNPCCNG